jgi:hypothetical protein
VDPRFNANCSSFAGAPLTTCAAVSTNWLATTTPDSGAPFTTTEPTPDQVVSEFGLTRAAGESGASPAMIACAGSTPNNNIAAGTTTNVGIRLHFRFMRRV